MVNNDLMGDLDEERGVNNVLVNFTFIIAFLRCDDRLLLHNSFAWNWMPCERKTTISKKNAELSIKSIVHPTENMHTPEGPTETTLRLLPVNLEKCRSLTKSKGNAMTVNDPNYCSPQAEEEHVRNIITLMPEKQTRR